MPETITANDAFTQLLDALKRECMAASGDEFDRVASYRRTIDKLAQRFKDGLPQTDRSSKGAA